MKKLVLAAAALALSAGAAFAENPRVGEPENLYANDRTPVAQHAIPKVLSDRVLKICRMPEGKAAKA
jgi:hypothetical protein